MKKIASFLALLLIVIVGGCNRGDDFNDTITKGTWRVDNFDEGGDDHTGLFAGYVFTFLDNGTVTVTRPGEAPPVGYWNEYNYGTRMEFTFGGGYPLDKLNDTWVIDNFNDDEINFHELDTPATRLQLQRF